jgi:hypothetical protein
MGTGFSTYLEAVHEKEYLDKAVVKREEDLGVEKVNVWKHRVGVAEMGMGVSATAMRPLALQAGFQGIDPGLPSASWLGQVAFTFNTFLSFFSAFWFAAVAASSWLNLKDIRRLEEGIENKDPRIALDFLRSEIDPKFLYTWNLLHQRHEKEANDVLFTVWLKKVLASEAKNLAKSFLLSVNQYEDRSLDFDKMADKFLDNMQERSGKGENTLLREGFFNFNLGLNEQDEEIVSSLTSLELMGLEFVHRNRLERGQFGLIRAFGEELAHKTCEYLDKKESIPGEESVLLEQLQDKITVQKRIAIAGVVFGGLGSAVVSAGYAAAIAMYFPLCTAAAFMTAGISIIATYIDIHSIWKKMGMPEGKYEERMNNIKLILGIAMVITIVVVASASTFGTVPGIIAFSALVTVVAIYLARRARTHWQRMKEQKFLCSAEDLIALRQKAMVIEDEKLKTKQIHKIQNIVAQKLLRTPVRAPFDWKKRIVEEIKEDTWEKKIRDWEKAEQDMAEALKEAFDYVAVDKESYTYWERISEFFQGIPHLNRAFPAHLPV